jgi:hypothetical protein
VVAIMDFAAADKAPKLRFCNSDFKTRDLIRQFQKYEIESESDQNIAH